MKLSGKLFLFLMLGVCASIHAAADSKQSRGKKVREEGLEVVGTAAVKKSKVSNRRATPPPSRPGTAARGARRVSSAEAKRLAQKARTQRMASSFRNMDGDAADRDPGLTRQSSKDLQQIAAALARKSSKDGDAASDDTSGCSSSLNDPRDPKEQKEFESLLASAFKGGSSSDIDDL